MNGRQGLKLIKNVLPSGGQIKKISGLHTRKSNNERDKGPKTT